MSSPIPVLFCLPGLHRVSRGAEIAFESVAEQLARSPGFDVTLIGSGQARADRAYRFLHAPCVTRDRFERWPSLPIFRSDCHYEEFTFVPGFLRHFDPSNYAVVVTCSYPFLNWAIRLRKLHRARPVHVFVTQNGDWPLHRRNSEYRLFDCDALVCTNPDYFDAHAASGPSRLIPNGVDCSVFRPGPAGGELLRLPAGVPVLLIVSALIASKRVAAGIEAAARVPDLHLVVAGDGPLRDEVDRRGAALMGERFHRVSLPPEEMPGLYRRAHALLHMSLDEPFGNVYVEALATGLPVIAHDRAVTRWVLDRFGRYVDTTRVDAVADEIRSVMSEKHDPSAAAAYAREHFSWAAVAERYGEFFRALVAMQRA